jgi:hypothetical protein
MQNFIPPRRRSSFHQATPGIQFGFLVCHAPTRYISWSWFEVNSAVSDHLLLIKEPSEEYGDDTAAIASHALGRWNPV